MANENRHLIKISGVPITLTSKKDTYFDMDSAKSVRSWKTGIYVDSVISLLDPQEFTVEGYDRYKKKRVTKTMYCSDRTTEDLETVNGTKSTLSFNLIEV